MGHAGPSQLPRRLYRRAALRRPCDHAGIDIGHSVYRNGAPRPPRHADARHQSGAVPDALRQRVQHGRIGAAGRTVFSERRQHGVDHAHRRFQRAPGCRHGEHRGGPAGSAVDRQPAIPVTFAHGPDLPGFISNMHTAINTGPPSQCMTGTLSVEVTPVADGIRQLRVTSGGGSVAISSAQQSDVAAALQLGIANGGIEISRWSRARTAPTGIVGRLNNAADDLGRLHALAIADQNTIGEWRLTDPGAGMVATPYHATPFVAPAAQPMYVGTSFVPAAGDSTLGSFLNVRQHLGEIAASIANNTKPPGATNNRFSASVQGLRLAVVPRFEGSDAGVDSLLSSAGATNIGAGGELFDSAAPGAYNVRAYTVGRTGGVQGAGPFQGGSVAGTNGGAPNLQNYTDSFPVIDRAVDIFNLMVL